MKTEALHFKNNNLRIAFESTVFVYLDIFSSWLYFKSGGICAEPGEDLEIAIHSVEVWTVFIMVFLVCGMRKTKTLSIRNQYITIVSNLSESTNINIVHLAVLH